ncbi:hypothetical protein T08_6463 [Trichinella sp. T8]|nr:hypothetical protein T08_6463 [Trichinella sp. T8]
MRIRPCAREACIYMREEEQYEQYQKQYHQQWINITMLTIAAQMFIAAWKQNAAEDLLAKKTTIVGTLRRNKTEVPSELTEAMGREVGSSLFCFDRQLTLVSYILKRKKCVLLLSTMHHDDAVNEDQERKADIVL